MPSKKSKKTKKTTVTKATKKPMVKKSTIKKVVKKTPLKAKKPAAKSVKNTKKPAAKPLTKAQQAKEKKLALAAKLAAKNAAKEKKAKAKITSKTSQKIIARGKIEKATAAEKKPEAPKQAEKKHEIHKAIIARKSEGKKQVFKAGDYAVYPSHGVGKIIEIKKTLVLNQDFSCYIMFFEKEKLSIKIPVNSAEKIGLRHLVSKSQMDEVFGILRSGIKKLKGMWSRRAQEYETKINSGHIILLAEVLRDLTRDIEDGERSYSERIIYETAVHRLASEYSIIYGISFEEAKEKVVVVAKDKLNSEGKVNQKDEFDDEFDLESKNSDLDEDEESEEEDEDEEEEDEDEDYDDDDDDEKPKRKSRK